MDPNFEAGNSLSEIGRVEDSVSAPGDISHHNQNYANNPLLKQIKPIQSLFSNDMLEKAKAVNNEVSSKIAKIRAM